MITEVIYARLFNLGNYENERLEVKVTVEDGSAAALEGAWEDARAAVEEQHARLQAQREEAERRQREAFEAEQARHREEYESRMAQERAEREAARQRPQMAADGGDLAF